MTSDPKYVALAEYPVTQYHKTNPIKSSVFNHLSGSVSGHTNQLRKACTVKLQVNTGTNWDELAPSSCQSAEFTWQR